MTKQTIATDPAQPTNSAHPDPNATHPDPRGVGRRQPPHGVSQENASNAMATHPTEVGGTRPVLPQAPNPDEPRRA